MIDIDNFFDDYPNSSRLKEFVKCLVASSEKKENQLGYYILMELSFELLDIQHFNDILDKISSQQTSVTFNSFITNRPNITSNECLLSDILYSRVVAKDAFHEFYGGFDFDEPYINNEMVKSNGWSTRNGIVWVTPTNEINSLIETLKNKTNISDTVCDYLGIQRQVDDVEYYKIDYSPNFKDCCFQPNSSNILWCYDNILFIPYKKYDFFGRTYNENGVIFAREQVHAKSFFVDEKFHVSSLGQATKGQGVYENLILEIKNRLSYEC